MKASMSNLILDMKKKRFQIPDPGNLIMGQILNGRKTLFFLFFF
jgi:hypothetical protein